MENSTFKRGLTAEKKNKKNGSPLKLLSQPSVFEYNYVKTFNNFIKSSKSAPSSGFCQQPVEKQKREGM